MQSIFYFILVPMVYIAFAVFFIGTIIRLAILMKTPKHPATLQIYPEKQTRWFGIVLDAFLFPTVFRHKPLLWIFLIVFHGALVLLVIGHLELIWDLSLFQVIPHEPFLGKGFVGLALIIAVLYFLFRRIKEPVKSFLFLKITICLFSFLLSFCWAAKWTGPGDGMNTVN